ncbi:MAG: hypothetical protein E2O61_10605 [Gammaproteobacteria bacterium]|nr:MAG: hypothetical protein E2O61_10605 [Gammaproteobacteria bacterium]
MRVIRSCSDSKTLRHAGFSWTLFVLIMQWHSYSLAQVIHEQASSFAQTSAGRTAYDQHCASCHGASLEGLALAPSLAGERFAVQWAGKSVDVLFSHMRRMPLQPVAEPGSLTEETYLNILAYVLQHNDIVPDSGDDTIPIDAASLVNFVIPTIQEKQTAATGSLSATTGTSDLLNDLPAVTDEMLNNPSPDDWLIWRRTYDSKGFSPLRQINRHNVANLKLAWRAPLRAGDNMPSPLIHQGVMFFHTYPDTVLAMDAANGRVLWRHQYNPKSRSSKKMGIALHGDKVLVPTSDLHLLALNAKTGEVIWDHAIATESPMSERYQLRSAPLVAGNKVIQGIMSFRVPKGSFIVAVDIATGIEAWRFNTVARPGEPGGNTWNDLPLEQRNGGSVWVTGSYDAELNLVYFGAAPTYDTGPLLVPVDKQGVNNDALYTNATVALNPETGELVWHYQHLANDQWDLDWAFERQIVNLPVDGVMRKVVLTVGKMAILDALDAATGEYLFSIDLGLQNVVSFIDPETGIKTINPDTVPSLTETRLICPSAVGARSWPPTSYNPRTYMLYLPLTEGCMAGGPEGFKGLLTSGVGLSMRPHPDSSDGNMGRLQAVDLANRQLAWSYRQPTPLVSASLATGGGLVFLGDLDPSLKAFDQTSGKLLWRAALSDIPGSGLVTYSVNGKQYLAVVVGQPNNVARDWSRIYRDFAQSRGIEIKDSPKGGAAVLVFALDDLDRG